MSCLKIPSVKEKHQPLLFFSPLSSGSINRESRWLGSNANTRSAISDWGLVQVGGPASLYFYTFFKFCILYFFCVHISFFLFFYVCLLCLLLFVLFFSSSFLQLMQKPLAISDWGIVQVGNLVGNSWRKSNV